MSTEPQHAYLVCATPRSGSTLLCEMLRETGVAGHPVEHFEVLRHSSLPRQPREYFVGCANSHVLELLAPVEPSHPSTEAPERWWARIVAEGTTPNGVWGGKLMWGHVEDFLSRARELPGLADADLAQALSALLNDPKFIFVTREDKVAQAVSLWRALQTQAWRADNAPNGDGAAYDFEGIDHLAVQLQADEDAWRDWFAGTGGDPLTVAYEALDAAPRATVAQVLAELGLDEAVAPRPPIARQRDDVSEEWIARYQRERGQAA
jgi:trehalose 2-sulfotransferase